MLRQSQQYLSDSEKLASESLELNLEATTMAWDISSLVAMAA